MIKAVFIDIDDTLTSKRHYVSEENIKEINRCVNKGIKIILTSGRSRGEAEEYLSKIGASPYVISSNGAGVYDVIKKVVVYSEPLEKEVVNRLLEFSVKNDYKIRLNYNDEIALNRAIYPDEESQVKSIEELKEIIQKNDILQCVISNKDLEKVRNLKKYLHENYNEIKIVNEPKKLSDPNAETRKIYYCDVASKNVSKGKAVKALCEYLKINENEIITIGDGENDLSMFEITPNSVAMGNSIPKVKEKAKYITLPNYQNGVAEVLKNL